MKKVELTTSISVYESVQELPKDVSVLMQKAIEAKKMHMLHIQNLKLVQLCY